MEIFFIFAVLATIAYFSIMGMLIVIGVILIFKIIRWMFK